jgi:hypothetical protein
VKEQWRETLLSRMDVLVEATVKILTTATPSQKEVATPEATNVLSQPVAIAPSQETQTEV